MPPTPPPGFIPFMPKDTSLLGSMPTPPPGFVPMTQAPMSTREPRSLLGTFGRRLGEELTMGYGWDQEVPLPEEQTLGHKIAGGAGAITGMIPSFMLTSFFTSPVVSVALKAKRAAQLLNMLNKVGKPIQILDKAKKIHTVSRLGIGAEQAMRGAALFGTHGALVKPETPEGEGLVGRLKTGAKQAPMGAAFGGSAALPLGPAGRIATAGGIGAGFTAIEGGTTEDILINGGLLSVMSALHIGGSQARALLRSAAETIDAKPPGEKQKAIDSVLKAAQKQQAEIDKIFRAKKNQEEIERHFPPEARVKIQQFRQENPPELIPTKTSKELELARKKYGIPPATYNDYMAKMKKQGVVPRGETLPARIGPEPEAIPEAEVIPEGLLPYPDYAGKGFTRGEVPPYQPYSPKLGQKLQGSKALPPGQGFVLKPPPTKKVKAPPNTARSELKPNMLINNETMPQIVDRVMEGKGVRGELKSIAKERSLDDFQDWMNPGKMYASVRQRLRSQGLEKTAAKETADRLIKDYDWKYKDVLNEKKGSSVLPPGPKKKGVTLEDMEKARFGQVLLRAQEKKPAKPLPPKPKAKEPWEITYTQVRSELERLAGTTATEWNKSPIVKGLYPKSPPGRPDYTSLSRKHKASIQQALSEGKPVPSEVLKDYPDLAPKVEVKATPGRVWYKDKQYPFKEFREFKKGKNKDKIQVQIGQKKVFIPKEDVTSWPGETKPVTLESLGFQTMYENLVDSFKKGEEKRARETVDSYRKAFLDPVKGNPLDRIAVGFLKTEAINTYFNNMPKMGDIKPSELFKYDPEAKAYIAQYLTKDGNLKPAVRQSGFHALKEFADGLKIFKDIGKGTATASDPTRLIQAIDQGKWGGPCQKHILWPARMNTLAKLRYGDIKSNKLADIAERYKLNTGKERRAVGDIIEHISNKQAWGWEIPKILEIEGVKKGLQKFPPRDRPQLASAAVSLRKFFDELFSEQNTARKLRKQKLIPYRGFYRPWVMETNLWSQFWGLKRRPKEVMQGPEMPDFIQPNQPFNPRAEARTNLMAKYPKERDIVRLMGDYIETASKDIFDTNTVHNNKIHSTVLRAKGLENAADGVESWTSEVFAGTKPRISRAFGALPTPVRAGMKTIRRNITRAVFPLNWTWNTFIQTSSASITLARYGPKASLAGRKYFTDRAMRQAVKQNAYSSIIKSRWGGKAAYQDIQGSILKNKRLHTSLITKAEDYANFLTNAMEDTLTGHAVAAAYYDGKTRLKLTGRELWEYASEGGAKTQSMYNFGDVPGLLRAREVGQLAPFQTFAFEVFNTVREMNIPVLRRVVGKTGLYETMNANSVAGKALISRRVKMLAYWTAGMLVANAVTEKAIGRKPWEPSSFLPFLDLLVGGRGTRPILPKQFVTDFNKGVKDLFQHGSWRKLRKWAVQYNLVAGIQINRTLDGLQAVAEGEVRDVKGRRMYPVKGDAEKLKAVTMGPTRTEAGKEYYKKRFGKSESFLNIITGSKNKPVTGYVKRRKRPTRTRRKPRPR